MGFRPLACGSYSDVCIILLYIYYISDRTKMRAHLVDNIVMHGSKASPGSGDTALDLTIIESEYI